MFIFQVQLLQKTNTDLVNSKIPKAYYSERWEWDKSILLQIKPLKVNSKLYCRIFIFVPPELMG